MSSMDTMIFYCTYTLAILEAMLSRFLVNLIAIPSHSDKKNAIVGMIGFELMLKVEAHPGIEPSYKDLQSSA